MLCVTEKCSGLLATKLGCFEPHVIKKTVFFQFYVLNTLRLALLQETCFGLFAVKLGCYQSYCTKEEFLLVCRGLW